MHMIVHVQMRTFRNQRMSQEDNSSSEEECITTEIVTDFDEIIYSATNITDT